MSNRQAFHIPEEDLIQYVLGTLKDTQMSQFTAHISLCNECRGQLGDFQVELASFAAVQPMEELPAGARSRFLARLSADAAPESKFVQMRNKSKTFNTPTHSSLVRSVGRSLDWTEISSDSRMAEL